MSDTFKYARGIDAIQKFRCKVAMTDPFTVFAAPYQKCNNVAVPKCRKTKDRTTGRSGAGTPCALRARHKKTRRKLLSASPIGPPLIADCR
ncbi:hypothetical protein [Sphingomonas sp. PAMC 26621]|uniref:hypothetical protein n=1 Tax=Sphingomonas sp. PAMC 26621 TaxID=1112213 RepID=UPI0011113420|nr:hypothetical protein [Sphingomonas sp. PAMC 26621]